MKVSLEEEIERAWLDLLNCKQGHTLGLTSGGRILNLANAKIRSRWVEIGRYNRAVTLKDFRDDVYHCWEELKR